MVRTPASPIIIIIIVVIPVITVMPAMALVAPHFTFFDAAIVIPVHPRHHSVQSAGEFRVRDLGIAVPVQALEHAHHSVAH